jgi:hypothetical protein
MPVKHGDIRIIGKNKKLEVHSEAETKKIKSQDVKINNDTIRQ